MNSVGASRDTTAETASAAEPREDEATEDAQPPGSARTPVLEGTSSGGAGTPEAPSPADLGRERAEPSMETDEATTERLRARAVFAEANEYFARGQYREALARYRDTVALWDHPAVHFNMTVCLIHLDEPIEAYAHIRRVVEVDPQSVGADFYERAVTYDKLLSAQLARLEVSCTQPDVLVSFDGKQLLACPGTDVQFTLPGQHQLVASGPGLVTSARSLDLRAGTSTSQTIELDAVSAAPGPEVIVVRRWKPWVPWVPGAIGVAAVGIGVGLRVAAVRNVAQYDEEFARQCPQGCTSEAVPESLQQVWSRAQLQNGLAIGLLAAGGAAVVSAAVLLVLNRPRSVERPRAGVRVAVGRGIAVLGRF